MDHDLHKLLKSLENIEENLVKINNRLDNLEAKINKISGDTEKMDKHVDFISNIYQQVKYPFHYVMDYVDSWSSIAPSNSYSIENNKND